MAAAAAASASFRIAGLGGSLCEISDSSGAEAWTVRRLKAAIERKTGIPTEEQRLLVGSQEVLDAHTLPFTEEGEGCRGLDVTLVRRPPERDLWLSRVEEDWYALLDAPSWARADAEIVLAAIRQSPKAIEHASDDLKYDHDMLLAAMQQDISALEFVPMELWADREFVLAAVQLNGLVLLSAAQELRADPSVVIAAMRQDMASVRFADVSLRTNREVATEAVKINGLALKWLIAPFRADRDIVMTAVRQNPAALEMAAQELREDPAFRSQALQGESSAPPPSLPGSQRPQGLRSLGTEGAPPGPRV